MTKKYVKSRPAFLQKEYKEPYKSLVRCNVGSFLDKYKQEHGQLGEPRAMLNHFFQFLGKQKTEFKDLKASEINTKDVTTKAIYDVLRAKIDSRKRKPKASPKQDTSYLEFTPY